MASALDELKKIQDERRKLDERQAKIENDAASKLMDKINELIAELATIGRHYTLTERSRSSVLSAKRETAKRVTNTDQPCKICGFKTLPYHDARRHRSQDEKRPFTAKELTEMGMVKV